MSQIYWKLNFEWISLGQFAFFPNAGSLQRLNGARFIDVNDRIELFWEPRVKIMAQPFAFRPINHTDCALDPALLEDADLAGTPQIDPKSRQTSLVKQLFVTAS